MERENSSDACPMVQIRPRPESVFIGLGRAVMATDLTGMISGDQDGLFLYQTRLLSRYRYRIDGGTPKHVISSPVEQHSWRGYYIHLPPGIENLPRDRGSGGVEDDSQHTLELRVSRYIGDGLHEDIDFTNYSQVSTSFTFEIELDSDFADLNELDQDVLGLGRKWQQWNDHGTESSLEIGFQADNKTDSGTLSVDRRLFYDVSCADSKARYSENRIRFTISLGPGASWHACINVRAKIDETDLTPVYSCDTFSGENHEYDKRRYEYLKTATQFSGGPSGHLGNVFTQALSQAKRDLVSLRLFDLDASESAWTMAAGLPVYIALFGRDTLTAAWQASLTSPQMMEGTLAELARWQGEEVNVWRDEEPGRMLHEAHTGPMPSLGKNPRSRYYGSITTAGFYPFVLSELWHWTGNKDLVRSFLQPATRALKWLDECTDLLGNGFHMYLTRSSQGVKHQAWKDSGDAVIYPDGTQVHPPIATCEEQGIAYAAKLGLSEVLFWLGEKDDAKRFYREAWELKKRFNDAFWMDDQDFVAFGLDSENRQIRSIVSNPGHCVATGILETDRVEKVADRLMAEDLFSGWGVRTLSDKNPAYNPYSYHRGSVWPVENGSFALGFARYGLISHLHTLCRGQLEAASLFTHARLPEVFSGHKKNNSYPFPAIYPRTNWPQAWSSSAIFCYLQALLGLYPYAPMKTLIVDPQLPEWLPEITLRRLRVGDAAVDIRFFRKNNEQSDYEVLEKRGSVHVVRQPSPWSVSAGSWERLKDLITSLLPGR